MTKRARHAEIPVADWELERHGKHRQPSPLVRRLRHIQYVILHRSGDRRLVHLVRWVHQTPPGQPSPTPPLVEFLPDQFSPPDHDRSEQIASAMHRYPDPELRAAWLTENAVTWDELRAAWESFTQGPGPGAPLPTWPQHQREDLDR